MVIKNNCKIKRILFGIIFFLLLGINVHSIQIVEAATQKATLMVLEESCNVVVSIEYDVEHPLVYFIAPNGDKYKENNAKKKKMKIEEEDKVLRYYISDAMPGTWQIVYDKRGNSKLDVHFADFADALAIESFQFGKPKDDSIITRFKCTYSSDIVYDFEISAVTKKDEKVLGTKLLAEGSVRANESQEIQINIDSLATYDEYFLQLEVYTKIYDLEIGDTIVSSKSFSYEQKNAPAILDNCYFTVDITEKNLNIDWSESNVYADQFIVAVFSGEKKGEPLFYQTLEPDSTAAVIPLDVTQDNMTAEVSYIEDGLTSNPLVMEIPLKQSSYQFVIETDENTNAKQVTISYDVVDEIPVVIEINGEAASVVADGKGNYSFALQEMKNECTVSYQANEYLNYLLKKSIYVDSMAPVFNFYEDYSNIKTYDKVFTIVGNTEKEAKLYINNKEYSVDSDGGFLAEVNLGFGENVFEIKSCDKFGNAAKQTLIISRITKSSLLQKLNFKSFQKWLPMFCVFIGTFVIGIFCVIFYELRIKRKPNEPYKTLRIVHCILTTVLLVVTIVAMGYVAYKAAFFGKVLYSKDYYELVKNSVEEAYLSKEYFKWSLCGTAILFVLTIIFLCLLCRQMRKVKNHIEPEKKIRKTREKVHVQKKQSCPHCGELVEEGIAFCGRCGKQLKEK